MFFFTEPEDESQFIIFMVTTFIVSIFMIAIVSVVIVWALYKLYFGKRKYVPTPVTTPSTEENIPMIER